MSDTGLLGSSGSVKEGSPVEPCLDGVLLIRYSLRWLRAEGPCVVDGVTVVTGLVTVQGGGGVGSATCSFHTIFGLTWVVIMVVGRSLVGSLGRIMFGRFNGSMLGRGFKLMGGVNSSAFFRPGSTDWVR